MNFIRLLFNCRDLVNVIKNAWSQSDHIKQLSLDITEFDFFIAEIRHPEELSLCKPLDVEHLKVNYGEVKQAEEKKRRVTLGSMPSQCQRRETFSANNSDNTERVRGCL